MPFAKIRQDYTPQPAPAAQLTAELDQIAPAHSPARALQQRLAQRAVAASSQDYDRWSPRRSLALIVTVSAALWMAIIVAGAEVAKLIV